ncbi:MAG TPA: MBL fold metallo-hydrolase [Dongiaceae bacterium]|nr:MBL fold metallo-hydrolase [Dongiaceae bacterium]
MKLQIFQSEKGDCLLLESADGHRILCDGGMAGSMRKHVRAELEKLRKKKQKLDAVYISHIDQDHISGVLALLEDEVAWRVHDHHKKNGDAVAKPDVPRPPEIKTIWHNSFSAQLGSLNKPVESLLAAAAPSLLATGVPELKEVGEELYDIATSIPEAIKVSRLASPDLLGIPLNKIPGQTGKTKLLMRRPSGKPFRIGAMTLTILGPGNKELEDLRTGWKTWLDANEEAVKKIDRELKKKMDEFSNSSLAPMPIDLRDWNGIPDHKGVTAPNIASLMFMVEENGKRLLLTGDSQQDFILTGLEETGFLANGHLHLDVHKVQHHGSEHNLDDKFVRIVSADHYVLCGNGQHENPDLTVIQKIFDSRLGPASKRAKAPQADGRKFKLWFSTQKDGKTKASDDHMAEVQKLVKKLVTKSNGKMSAVFNKGASTTLVI